MINPTCPLRRPRSEACKAGRAPQAPTTAAAAAAAVPRRQAAPTASQHDDGGLYGRAGGAGGSRWAPRPHTPPAAVPAATTLYEQVVFDPVLVLGALVVNTTIPPQISATSCYSAAASGWTMALDPGTGGSLPASFFEDATKNHNVLNVGTTPVSGLALGGTGSFSIVQYGSQYYGITQTTTSPFIGALNPPGNLKGKRLTWIQKR